MDFLGFLLLFAGQSDLAENRHVESAVVHINLLGGMVELVDQALIERLFHFSALFAQFLIPGLQEFLLVLLVVPFAGLGGHALDQQARSLL